MGIPRPPTNKKTKVKIPTETSIDGLDMTKYKIHKSPEYIGPGIVYMPYVIKNVVSYINSKMVWHHNPIVRIWFKIKYFLEN